MKKELKYLTDKTHRILKVQWATYKSDGELDNVKMYDKCNDWSAFKALLIEQFSGKTLAQLDEDHEHDAIKVGIELLAEKRGLEYTTQWDSVYIAIPLEDKKLMEFVEKYKPSWLEDKKRMSFWITKK